MTVISVIGTSGVGKSFLVKQLSSVTCYPAFFEGEEGTIPQNILDSVFNGTNPVERWKFFIDRYKLNLTRAIEISKSGNHCFVDGSTLSPQATIVYEKAEYRNELQKLCDSLEELKSDVVILITANKEKLSELMQERSRSSEQSDKAIERASDIQDSFVALSKNENNILLIDRTNLEFKNPEHIQEILDKVKEKCSLS